MRYWARFEMVGGPETDPQGGRVVGERIMGLMAAMGRSYNNFQLVMSLNMFNKYLDTGDLWGS